MSEKRRDSKNRILRSGESQRKDGRYAFKYTDALGKPKFIYAWKLVPTDKTPAGKREDISLRGKEKEIQKDLDDGIDTLGKKMTVCQLYAKHTRQKGNVRKNTKTARNQLMRILEEDTLGACSIDTVKMSDAKEWVLRMKEKGFSYNTVKNHKRSLIAIFYTAIENDYLRKNPFNFNIDDVIENDTEPKEPLSLEQKIAFLSFVEKDKVYRKYLDEFIILLGTGIRISEYCGLTDADVDMENRVIDINHQLLYCTEIGYYIDEPKTKSGFRRIKMTEEVYQAFRRILDRRRFTKTTTIDGYSNFIFVTRTGNPKIGINYNSMFRGLVKKYNKDKTNKIALPEIFTLHTLRHTFCTEKANEGMSPKALQYIMGHANVAMTLNYYAHGTFESASAEMERLEKRKLQEQLAA